ncbi:MAG: FHA domain-containing protein [Actinomycetota bacterium]|nr:FHA domain-containing protein [Actinomycetota bacterium]
MGTLLGVGLKGFERRLERLVEGAFARAFKSSLRPVELGRRLTREMDHQRTVNVRGEMAAPNDFTVTLGPEDHSQFAEIGDSLSASLADAAREHARDEGYAFMGPVEVQIEVDPDLGAGSFGLSARFKEGVGGTGGGALVLSDGARVTLADTLITIGRSPDSSVHLPDSSVSRHHAEIRPAGDGWLLADKGSTNGTRVNGATITQRRLADGDTITVGDVKLRFEAS